MEPIFIISVVRDFAQYTHCIKNNRHLHSCACIALDNREKNEGLSLCYNRFIQTRPIHEKAWYVFCHEDFEFLESLRPKLKNLKQQALWGPIGARTRLIGGIYPQWELLGVVEECEKDGANIHHIGQPVQLGTKVETFDCQCLIVHSTLIHQFNLRFDEALTFDLYVEEFCIAAKKQAQIPACILPFKCRHWSPGSIQPRYAQQEHYLRQKYPHDCFTGISSYSLGGGGSYSRRLIEKAKKHFKKVLLIISSRLNRNHRSS